MRLRPLPFVLDPFPFPFLGPPTSVVSSTLTARLRVGWLIPSSLAASPVETSRAPLGSSCRPTAKASTSRSLKRRCPPGVTSAGWRRPRATARKTVAWLTPRRAATSFELINLCKTFAGATQLKHLAVPFHNLRAWDSKRGAGVSSLKICKDRPARSWISCQNFQCATVRADLQKGIGNSFSVRTSPPAAKLGAGVEKSPGPSLFYALFTSPLAGEVGGEAAGWGGPHPI